MNFEVPGSVPWWLRLWQVRPLGCNSLQDWKTITRWEATAWSFCRRDSNAWLNLAWGEPGNFGTGYWGRKIQELLSWFVRRLPNSSRLSWCCWNQPLLWTAATACTTQDPAERKLKLTTELNNGRLAMVAMTAMLIQSGTPSGDQLQSPHLGYDQNFPKWRVYSLWEVSIFGKLNWDLKNENMVSKQREHVVTFRTIKNLYVNCTLQKN